MTDTRKTRQEIRSAVKHPTISPRRADFADVVKGRHYADGEKVWIANGSEYDEYVFERDLTSNEEDAGSWKTTGATTGEVVKQERGTETDVANGADVDVTFTNTYSGTPNVRAYVFIAGIPDSIEDDYTVVVSRVTTVGCRLHNGVGAQRTIIWVVTGTVAGTTATW